MTWGGESEELCRAVVLFELEDGIVHQQQHRWLWDVYKVLFIMKSAYELGLSELGSEMVIRDRCVCVCE